MLLLAIAACGPDPEQRPDVPRARVEAADADADGDGDPDTTDCDDADPSVHAGAVEGCDAVDDDCDGTVDESACPCVDDSDGTHAFLFCRESLTWADARAACANWGYHLADVEDATEDLWIWSVAETNGPGDAWWHGAHEGTAGGWGWDGGADAGWTRWASGSPPAGSPACGAFGDDGEGAWIAEDCSVPHAFVCEAGCLNHTWYDDADGDGYGDPARHSRACAAPAGTVANATDCDDLDPSVSPAGPETCGRADEDCDGLWDDDDPSLDRASATPWHPDTDGDGFGDPGDTARACAAPTGFVADASDCDDADAEVHPGADALGDCDEDTGDEGGDATEEYEGRHGRIDLERDTGASTAEETSCGCGFGAGTGGPAVWLGVLALSRRIATRAPGRAR